MIRQKVVDFELSEDILLVREFTSKILVQKGIFQFGECRINDSWEHMKVNVFHTIRKWTMSTFGCIWIVDNLNNIYYTEEISFYSQEINTNFQKSKHIFYSHIKDIYASNDRLYVITRDNKVFVKEGIYDLTSSKCSQGKVIIFIITGFYQQRNIKAFKSIKQHP